MLTNVGQSWADPSETFRVNAIGTLNLLEAAARVRVPPTVVLVSSAEVYGPCSDATPSMKKVSFVRRNPLCW